jgi:D-arabinonate dehydratase
MTRWADLDLGWLEEPISSDDIDGLVRIKAATPVPIAVGENEFSRYGFRDLVKAGAVDIIQADVSRVGGITEWIKIAHFAAAHDIRMAPHSFQEIHVSLLGAVGNALMLEIFQPEHPFQQMISEFFVIPPEIKTIVDGRVSMPQKPGLGLSVNWEYARQYQVRVIKRATHAEGEKRSENYPSSAVPCVSGTGKTGCSSSSKPREASPLGRMLYPA